MPRLITDTLGGHRYVCIVTFVVNLCYTLDLSRFRRSVRSRSSDTLSLHVVIVVLEWIF